MPLRFEGSDGQEVVYRSELTGLKVNPKLASGTFEV